jgi:hypothetical protein
MKIAINTKYTDKFTDRADRNLWRDFNGTFKNMDISPHMFLWHVKAGHPYTTQHRYYRKADNFLWGQHLATDHDNGDSFNALLEDPFIKQYAYALHTTPSHTKDNPRTRVVYILDNPVRNKDSYALMAQALCHKFSSADQSAKDPCRFFFGHKQGRVKFLNNILPIPIVAQELIEPFMKIKKAINNGGQVIGNATGVIKQELNKILAAQDGEKWHVLSKVSFTVGGYVGGGHVDYMQAKQQLLDTIQQREIKSLYIAQRAIDTGLNKGMAHPIRIQNEWQAMGVIL